MQVERDTRLPGAVGVTWHRRARHRDTHRSQEPRHAGTSPCLIAPDCCVGADGSLLTPLQLAELLSWKQHTSKKTGKSAGRAPKQRGAIRALENVTCDERWKRLGPFKPGEGKREDVITVLKYVEGNCKRERNKVFPE